MQVQVDISGSKGSASAFDSSNKGSDFEGIMSSEQQKLARRQSAQDTPEAVQSKSQNETSQNEGVQNKATDSKQASNTEAKNSAEKPSTQTDTNESQQVAQTETHEKINGIIQKDLAHKSNSKTAALIAQENISEVVDGATTDQTKDLSSELKLTDEAVPNDQPAENSTDQDIKSQEVIDPQLAAINSEQLSQDKLPTQVTLAGREGKAAEIKRLKTEGSETGDLKTEVLATKTAQPLGEEGQAELAVDQLTVNDTQLAQEQTAEFKGEQTTDIIADAEQNPLPTDDVLNITNPQANALNPVKLGLNSVTGDVKVEQELAGQSLEDISQQLKPAKKVLQDTLMNNNSRLNSDSSTDQLTTERALTQALLDEPLLDAKSRESLFDAQSKSINSLNHTGSNSPIAANSLLAGKEQAVQLSIARPVAHPDWSNKVFERITWMANADQQSAEIRLDPPDLGPLKVSLNIKNDQAQVVFTSASPQVRELLEQNFDRLKDMMGAEGFQFVDPQTQGQQQSHSKQSNQSMTQDFGEDEEVSAADPLINAHISGKGLIDCYI